MIRSRLTLEPKAREILAVLLADDLPRRKQSERVDHRVVGIDPAAGGLVDQSVFQGPVDAVLVGELLLGFLSRAIKWPVYRR
jgi:hypothetical protein